MNDPQLTVRRFRHWHHGATASRARSNDTARASRGCRLTLSGARISAARTSEPRIPSIATRPMPQSRQMHVIPLTGLILACGLALLGCSGERSNSSVQGSAAVHLKPPLTPLPEPTVRRMVYVPVYSSIYSGLDIRQEIIELAATVSIRNVSAQYPVILNFVRYYDSGGNLVREYLKSRQNSGRWPP